jgi:hypothetical protein
MKTFFDSPIYSTETDMHNIPMLQEIVLPDSGLVETKAIIEANKLGILRKVDFDTASTIFRELAAHYELEDSYDLQMQLVVHMMEDREPIDDLAVTVNDRGPFQIIQAHSEGDSQSPLELFGLYCKKNCENGGENILSFINQNADMSQLKAKEKAIYGTDLNEEDIHELKRHHRDAKEVITELPTHFRTLFENEKGKVITRTNPLQASKSAISGKLLKSLWDNVTVHDQSFHEYHYELLKEIGILQGDLGEDYKNYMHVEKDSDWAPADTKSGSIEDTSQLFDYHIVHKMEAGDFLLFNNRAWTHAVNNWAPNEKRDMFAMYA